MKKEEEQACAIKGSQVGKIGFIATEGYENIQDNYDCISVEELYNI